MNSKLAFLIATFFGSGRAPVAPGTFGSLATMPLAFLLAYYFGFWGIFSGVIVSFAVGLPAVSEVLKTSKHDPSYVVIDEVAGQLFSFILVADSLQFDSYSGFLYLFGFMLFRLFDITKPQPVRWADKKIKNALGVMLDDIFAGAYSAVILYLLNLWMNA